MWQAVRSARDYLLYLRRRQCIDRDWAARHSTVFSLHPDYRRPCPPDLERAHLRLWRPFRFRIRLDTLRICMHIAGRADPRIVPEEIFAAELEPCLTPPHWPLLLSHKSLCLRLLPPGVFPETYLHNLAGEFFDAAFRPLASSALDSYLRSFPYPVVLKPNIASSGGKGVCFAHSPQQLRPLLASRTDFLVQRLLRQHPFFEAFNPYGLNTLRVYTYKSVASDRIHVLNVALRMGRGGSLDNLTAGGIACYVRPDGRLNTYAVDKYGAKFDRHPDSGLPFGPNALIPAFSSLLDLTRELAAALPMIRIAGWDMSLDPEGRWRCIEVNLSGHSIRFAQYAGEPFFGELTDEVIHYCLRHPRRRRVDFRLA